MRHSRPFHHLAGLPTA